MKIEIKGTSSTIKELYQRFNKRKKEFLSVKSAEIVEELKNNTPVDTGLARSGWMQKDIGDAVIIHNDVPYIEHLNNGSSAQAPEFFVEKTLLKYGKPVGQLVKINPS